MLLKERDHQILRIALPAIITNVTVPLLGLVDTAIVGHMGDAAYIGAIAVGAMIFNLVYWVFSFLRMGTSGMTAQAWGRKDLAEIQQMLTHSLALSTLTSLLLLVLQWPLCQLMLAIIGPSADVRPLAATYFYIVVWGAPASLGLFSLTGWYIGMQNTLIPMFISITQNVVNILVSLVLVFGFHMKVEGVALGTIIAQYTGFLMGLVLLARRYKKHINIKYTKLRLSNLTPFIHVNQNIFLRTLCLVAVNLFFTSAGARQSTTILAVNTLLLQLYLLFSYIMDGFAYAGEALGGRYWGAGDMPAFRSTVRRLFGWGAIMTVIFTLVYVMGGMPFLRLLTDEPGVVEASHDYVWWAYLIPICGVAAFIWDGIFIGTTQTRGMLLSAALAAIVFFALALGLLSVMGNHGLWLAMVFYLFMRGGVQTVWFARMKT